MKKLVLFILLSATLFSTMEVVLKIAGNQLDAFQLTLIRFFIGGMFLLPFALMEIKKIPGRFLRKKISCICL